MSDTLSSQVAAEIRAELARSKVSQRALARKMGRSPNWVSLQVGGSRTIDLDDLEAIAEAMGVDVIDLLRRTKRRPGDTLWYTHAPDLHRVPKPRKRAGADASAVATLAERLPRVPISFPARSPQRRVATA